VTTRFVAIGVAPAVRERLDTAVAPIRRRFREVGWTDPDGWHVTLAFLGHLPDTSVPEIVEVLGGAVAGTAAPEPSAVGVLPRLAVGGATSFGGRVLVVEVVDDPLGHVAALGARVQGRLAEVGIPVHERAVRAHLTLARARRGRSIDAPLLAEVQRALDALPEVLAWQPRGVGVFSSHPRSDGPSRYVVDAEVPVVR
jgi:RNA 2',3'-cyclic 3'-phosphodiesterase